MADKTDKTGVGPDLSGSKSADANSKAKANADENANSKANANADANANSKANANANEKANAKASAKTKADDAGDRRRKIRAYLITAGCAFAVTVTYAVSAGVFAMKDVGVILGYLSNAFSIPGFLIICMSGLVFVKRQGGFDGVSYGTRYFFNWLIPQVWLSREERAGKMQNYHDYCERKREKERGTYNLSVCFLTVGGGFLAVGLLCLAAMNIWFPGTVLFIS